MEYIGQTHLTTTIPILFNSKQLLLVGPDKWGKTYFVKYFAKEIGYEYVLVGNKVADIKMMLGSPKARTVYHIQDLHLAHINAKNRLLKFLEENVPEDVIVFITTEVGKNLDTIFSRCNVIRCSSYKMEELGIEEGWRYYLFPSPTLMLQMPDNVEEIQEEVEKFISDPYHFNSKAITQFEDKIVLRLLERELTVSKHFKTAERVARLRKLLAKNTYIQSWQAIQFVVEDIRSDIV